MSILVYFAIFKIVKKFYSNRFTQRRKKGLIFVGIYEFKEMYISTGHFMHCA